MNHLCEINIIIITSLITSTILKSTSSPSPTTHFPRIQLQNTIIFKTRHRKTLGIKFFQIFQNLICKLPPPADQHKYNSNYQSGPTPGRHRWRIPISKVAHDHDPIQKLCIHIVLQQVGFQVLPSQSFLNLCSPQEFRGIHCTLAQLRHLLQAR